MAPHPIPCNAPFPRTPPPCSLDEKASTRLAQINELQGSNAFLTRFFPRNRTPSQQTGDMANTHDPEDFSGLTSNVAFPKSTLHGLLVAAANATQPANTTDKRNILCGKYQLEMNRIHDAVCSRRSCCSSGIPNTSMDSPLSRTCPPKISAEGPSRRAPTP